MTAKQRFLIEGFNAVGNGLANVVGRANLHLKPATITKSLHAKVRTKLREIETILRRLIVLLAAGLALAPPAPAAPSIEKKSASPKAGAQLVGIAHVINLLPVIGPSFSDAPLDLARPCPRPGPVSTVRLLAYIRALKALLASPDVAALRVARRLAAMKAAGDSFPICLPQARTYRMSAQLGTLATFLPHALNDVLRAAWNDSS